MTMNPPVGRWYDIFVSCGGKMQVEQRCEAEKTAMHYRLELGGLSVTAKWLDDASYTRERLWNAMAYDVVSMLFGLRP